MLVQNKFTTQNPNFNGKTKIFALTDSHLQTREKCALLSKIIKSAKRNNNVLLLDGGDMFKGIYPPQAEVNSYITAKKLQPNLEIVVNIGNNDPGYNSKDFEFFKKAVKTLSKHGIHIISANTVSKETDRRLDGIKPYAIIKRDGDRVMVTGFCINNLTQTTYGVKSSDTKETLLKLKESIKKEKPDGLIILNHDWFTESENLMKFAKEKGIKVDLLIGGHEHTKFNPDRKNKIYYPEAFNRSMYKFDLLLNNGKSSLRNIKVYKNKGLKINPQLDKQLTVLEKQSKLMDVVAPSVLNLPKSYSNPSPLGTFLADAMKKESNTDIAFFSTGFLMSTLPYKQGKNLLEYDIKKTMTATSPIQKVIVTPKILKQVFESALINRMYRDRGNAKFLQCSQNIKLVGEGNKQDNTYKLKQIFINNEPLLDKNGEALIPQKEYTCAIDQFIGNGGQGFNMLKEIPKEQVLKNGQELQINNVLKSALKDATKTQTAGSEYPTFEISDNLS